LRSVVGLDWFRRDWPHWLERLFQDLFWINLFWGLVNLLPIWPLDGGQISRELFLKYARSNAVRSSLILSIVTSGIFAINALIGWVRGEGLIPYLPQGDGFQVLFFAVFAVMGWQLLQQTSSSGGSYRMEDERYERAPWERDADWWKRG
jgi:stage IV sporulation protein FB